MAMRNMAEWLEGRVSVGGWLGKGVTGLLAVGAGAGATVYILGLASGAGPGVAGYAGIALKATSMLSLGLLGVLFVALIVVMTFGRHPAVARHRNLVLGAARGDAMAVGLLSTTSSSSEAMLHVSGDAAMIASALPGMVASVGHAIFATVLGLAVTLTATFYLRSLSGRTEATVREEKR